MIRLLVLTTLLFSVGLAEELFFVAPDGDDDDFGTIDRPLASIQKAVEWAQPGDTVFVREGEYTKYNHAGNTIEMTTCGEPDAYIVFMAYPGETPKIISPTWNAFVLRGISYVEINGFELEGVPHAMSDSSGNGIHLYDSSHHIRILNNHVHHFPGGGIGANNADYLHIEGNVVHHNAFYSGYQNSGISLYQCTNFDKEPGYHNIIRDNICYANENLRLPLWGGDKITDGNGIIFDDSRHEQASGEEEYTAWTLIENNLVFDNGGRGIHTYLSDRVMVINNTLYHNQRTEDIKDGELSVNNSGDISFYNNIAVPAVGNRGNRIIKGRRIEFDYNLYYNASIVSSPGPHFIQNHDPMFVNADLNPAVADFRLLPGSPAIDSGTAEFAAAADINGNLRPFGSGIDRGACEYVADTAVKTPATPVNFELMPAFPNPFNASTQIQFNLPNTDWVTVQIFNVHGRQVKTLTAGLFAAGMHRLNWHGDANDGSVVCSGIYFIRLDTRTGLRKSQRICLIK